MNENTDEFISFPKMPRLNRDIVITEKIDGTNAQIWIHDDGYSMQAGSRNRWITTYDDNYAFARWCEDNKTELLKLGPGRHYGEWWGSGIQRRYGLAEKRFSLFNVSRWGNISASGAVPGIVEMKDGAIVGIGPNCCHAVPVLYQGAFSQAKIELCLTDLRNNGSEAAPGFMAPEGIVVYHTAAKQYFKVTLDNDESPKGLVKP